MSLKRFHIICSFCFLITFSFASTKEDLISYDTGYTITKVRTGKSLKRSFIVASSFEGILMRLDYDGSLVWKHSLSGFMNHDIWVGDLDNDGIDEIVVANANGSVYCLDSQGVLKWQLDLGMTPVYSVSAIQVKGKMYVVCGAMDKNMYYITAEGVLAKTIPSENYSIEKTWGKTHQMPPPDSNQHITNFIRKAKFKGKSIVVVHGAVHATAAKGNLYLFEPLSEKPFDIINIKSNTGPIGDLQVIDQDNDGTSEILLGASSMIKGAKATMIHLDHIKNESQINFKKTNGIDGFGYRVVQNLLIDIKGEAKVFSLFGSRIVLSSYDLNEQEVLRSKYSFNDWCFDPYRKRIVLASAQSGGSAIHIINLKAKNWKKAYEEIEPIGKIATLKYNHQKLSKKIALFKKPAWERDPIQVCFMTEGTNNPFVKNKIKKLHSNYSSPIFLNNTWKTQKEIWNRKKLIGENKYNYAVDKRMKYSLKGKEAATQFKYLYLGDSKGASYWGGHGNDPMFYSLSTYDEIFKQAKGKPTVFVFPEVEDMHDDLKVVLDNYIFPLAEKAKKYNSKLYLRNKHVFWLGNVYLPMWKPIFTGQYKDVIIPSMEETTDKSMELSVASRMGIWASGVVNDWGARCARDNSSFDRLRQHSHQMLPNHFFRTHGDRDGAEIFRVLLT